MAVHLVVHQRRIQVYCIDTSKAVILDIVVDSKGGVINPGMMRYGTDCSRTMIYQTRMHFSRMCTVHCSSHLLEVCVRGPGVGLETPWVSAWRAPQVWVWKLPQARPLSFPPGCGTGDSPRPNPSTSPLTVGQEIPPGKTPQLILWMWTWRPPRPDPSTYPLDVGLETCNACWDTNPPVNRMTDRQVKNITFANCGR